MIRLRPSGADEVLIKRVRDWYEPGPGVFIEPQSLFSPAMLFTGSTTGGWYDPSDLTTLYRDAAGTLPVTAVEQPVGLMLDKSKQLVLGSELVTNGDFSSGTGWSVGTNWTISGGFATHTSGADGYITQSLAGKVTAGKTYKITSVFTGTAPILAGGNLTASNVTLVSGDIYVIANGTSLAIYSNANCTIDNISVRELPGNHAFNSSGNSANFPVLKEDATGRRYLSFNGTNQWLQTNSIDFTYGDKMFVSAGVRKLGSDGIVTELSQSISTNNGAFLIYTPGTAYRFDSKGSIQIIAAGGSATPPITNVISGIGDISGDQSILRVNGAQAAISTADQGTGNFGNYPLYIGARADSSLWFNGRLYGMVVAGKQASASEITSTETYLNQKTGAY